jgi:FkbM family methyltransferase
MAESAGSDGLVVAFEPWPDNVRRLQKLKALPGTVEVQDCAVTDRAADALWLHAGRNRSPYEWNIMGRDVNGVPTPAELRVRAVSLDGFFADRDAPSFVKVDVEGAEGLVIAGMRGLLAKARPVVLIEFHSEEGWDARRILFDAGYELRSLDGAPVARDAERVYHCLALPPA